jgi:hypothetical protein
VLLALAHPGGTHLVCRRAFDSVPGFQWWLSAGCPAKFLLVRSDACSPLSIKSWQKGVVENMIAHLAAEFDAAACIKRPVNAEIDAAFCVFLFRL